jgi:hypothetical protein
MSAFKPCRFVNIEILRQVDQDRLIEFLKKYEGYLKDRGFSFETNAEGEIEFAKLVEILLRPTPGVDTGLVDRLCLLHEVAETRRYDDLLRHAEAAGVVVSKKATPADVALQIMLLDPKHLLRMRAEIQISKLKTYIHFVSDALPPEDFPPPEPADIERLRSVMDNFFDQKRGGKGCKIFVDPDANGERFHFLISHGTNYTREGSVENGKSSSVCFRPENHDVIILDVRNNRLAVYNKSQGKLEREMYARAFGATFFGETDHFYQDSIFTLDPLRTKGKDALVCSDIEGIDEVKLVELHVSFKSKYKASCIMKSLDVFASMAEANQELPNNSNLIEAKLEFKMSGAKQPRNATVSPFGKTRYERNQDGDKIEEFFRKRAFMIADEPNKAA